MSGSRSFLFPQFMAVVAEWGGTELVMACGTRHVCHMFVMTHLVSCGKAEH